MTKAALRSLAASIITGPRWPCTSDPAVRSARNSVWPGKAKPASYSGFLAIGAVTTPQTAPESAKPTPVSIQRTIAEAWRDDGCPAITGLTSGRSSTGRALENTATASSGEPTRRTAVTPRTEAAATASRSPTTMKIGPESRSASQALAMISGPTPAGSPSVSAKGRGLVDAGVTGSLWWPSSAGHGCSGGRTCRTARLSSCPRYPRG